MTKFIFSVVSFLVFSFIYFGFLNTPVFAGVPMCNSINCTVDCSTQVFADGDTCEGTDGDDVMCGTSYNEIIKGGSGSDTICGFDGIDTLKGGFGDDSLFGGNDGDFLYGGWGEDDLDGGPDNDVLQGGRCIDMLDGGADNDDCRAGWGDNAQETVDNCGESGLDADFGKDDDPKEATKCEDGV